LVGQTWLPCAWCTTRPVSPAEHSKSDKRQNGLGNKLRSQIEPSITPFAGEPSTANSDLGVGRDGIPKRGRDEAAFLEGIWVRRRQTNMLLEAVGRRLDGGFGSNPTPQSRHLNLCRCKCCYPEVACRQQIRIKRVRQLLKGYKISITYWLPGHNRTNGP